MTLSGCGQYRAPIHPDLRCHSGEGRNPCGAPSPAADARGGPRTWLPAFRSDGGGREGVKPQTPSLSQNRQSGQITYPRSPEPPPYCAHQSCGDGVATINSMATAGRDGDRAPPGSMDANTSVRQKSRRPEASCVSTKNIIEAKAASGLHPTSPRRRPASPEEICHALPSVHAYPQIRATLGQTRAMCSQRHKLDGLLWGQRLGTDDFGGRCCGRRDGCDADAGFSRARTVHG